jgi:NTE family protein
MGIGLLAHLGLFKGDYFLKFFREKLAAKGVRTFRDLIMPGYENEKVDLIHKYRVHMLASDITRGRMLILPDDLDLEHYGVRPDDMDVAEAVRMSIAVPGVFRPVKLTGMNGVTSYLVDGGLLSNFPVQAFDRAPAPEPSEVSPDPLGLRRESESAAAIGIRLLRDRAHNIAHPFIAARAAYALISTALEAHDTTAAMKFDLLKSNRTVNVNTEAVSILKFNLTPLEREVLFNQGYIAMKNVLRPDFLERAEAAADASRLANARIEPG